MATAVMTTRRETPGDEPGPLARAHHGGVMGGVVAPQVFATGDISMSGCPPASLSSLPTRGPACMLVAHAGAP
jgi:hypothetical protein